MVYAQERRKHVFLIPLTIAILTAVVTSGLAGVGWLIVSDHDSIINSINDIHKDMKIASDNLALTHIANQHRFECITLQISKLNQESKCCKESVDCI